MITIAKMIREDKNVSRDDSFVQEEMAKVMELETEIANVSRQIKNSSRGQGVRGKSLLLVCAAVFNVPENAKHRTKWGKKIFWCHEQPKNQSPLCL